MQFKITSDLLKPYLFPEAVHKYSINSNLQYHYNIQNRRNIPIFKIGRGGRGNVGEPEELQLYLSFRTPKIYVF